MCIAYIVKLKKFSAAISPADFSGLEDIVDTNSAKKSL
jgi:hypothetical protein